MASHSSSEPNDYWTNYLIQGSVGKAIAGDVARQNMGHKVFFNLQLHGLKPNEHLLTGSMAPSSARPCVNIRYIIIIIYIYME